MGNVKIGDKIKIVNRITASEPYENGDILTVKDIRGDGAVYVEEHEDRPILPMEFIVVDIAVLPRDVAEAIETLKLRGWERKDLLSFPVFDPFDPSSSTIVEYIFSSDDNRFNYVRAILNGYTTELEREELDTEEPEPKQDDEEESASYVKVGDKIRIVKASGAGGYYRNGDEFTVDHLSPICPGGVFVKGIPIVINANEYEVIERAAEEPEAKFKVGDRVRIVDAINAEGYYKNGDIFTIRYIDEDGDLYVEGVDMVIYPREVELYNESEVAEPEPVEEEEPQKSLADEIAEKVAEILEMNRKITEATARIVKEGKLEMVAELLDEIEEIADDIFYKTEDGEIEDMTIKIDNRVSRLRSLLVNVEEL